MNYLYLKVNGELILVGENITNNVFDIEEGKKFLKNSILTEICPFHNEIPGYEGIYSGEKPEAYYIRNQQLYINIMIEHFIKNNIGEELLLIDGGEIYFKFFSGKNVIIDINEQELFKMVQISKKELKQNKNKYKSLETLLLEKISVLFKTDNNIKSNIQGIFTTILVGLTGYKPSENPIQIKEAIELYSSFTNDCLVFGDSIIQKRKSIFLRLNGESIFLGNTGGNLISAYEKIKRFIENVEFHILENHRIYEKLLIYIKDKKLGKNIFKIDRDNDILNMFDINGGLLEVGTGVEEHIKNENDIVEYLLQNKDVFMPPKYILDALSRDKDFLKNNLYIK